MLDCLFCASIHIKKHGILNSGAQRFLCEKCKKSFSLGGKRGTYNNIFKQHVIENYCHKKETAKTIVDQYGISSATLIKWSKTHKNDCSICKK